MCAVSNKNGACHVSQGYLSVIVPARVSPNPLWLYILGTVSFALKTFPFTLFAKQKTGVQNEALFCALLLLILWLQCSIVG